MYGELNITTKNVFLRKIFFQMFFGLLITGAVALSVASNLTMLNFVSQNITLIVIAEFALVLGLNFGINKISSVTAKFLFITYSAMTGLMLSAVMLIYTPMSILYILGVTSLIFVGMSLYGLKTKEDLSSYSGFFRGGLITLILVSILNIFLHITLLGWLISVFAVVLFTALIAYDINRIVNVFNNSNLTDEQFEKYSTIGALMLYLDFINLFINLLSLFGKKK